MSLKELAMSALCLLAKAEAEIVILFPCSYYMKIFMLWKLLTTFVTTELTPSPLWSQSKRLQAAQSKWWCIEIIIVRQWADEPFSRETETLILSWVINERTKETQIHSLAYWYCIKLIGKILMWLSENLAKTLNKLQWLCWLILRIY